MKVIAKSMRANRVSMRGLSRDIVGIMKDIQSKESRAIANTSQVYLLLRYNKI